MSTGSHLKITSMGDDVLGVRLEGNRSKPEPIHFRVTFPGGDVDVVRTTDGRYWVHLRVNHPEDGYDPDRLMASIAAARLTIPSMPPEQKPDLGDFANPGLSHLSFLIGRAPAAS